jgi:sugar lactone lactonase YvrE
VLATQAGFAVYEPGGDLSILENPLPAGDGVRFNDGIVDPLGRFWAGSLGAEDDALYLLEGRAATRFAGGFGLPNGMGFSPDERTLYFTDSDAKTIYAYAFDPETGEVGERRVFVDSHGEDGVPDGLTVDAGGYVWSARWGGWKLSRYHPDGRLERDIPIPAEQVTSCAFGGDNLDALFVTTAREGLSEDQLEEQPQAGSLFVLEPGARGKLEYRTEL